VADGGFVVGEDDGAIYQDWVFDLEVDDFFHDAVNRYLVRTLSQ
jgi:hypothetical protein